MGADFCAPKSGYRSQKRPVFSPDYMLQLPNLFSHYSMPICLYLSRDIFLKCEQVLSSKFFRQKIKWKPRFYKRSSSTAKIHRDKVLQQFLIHTPSNSPLCFLQKENIFNIPDIFRSLTMPLYYKRKVP